MQRMRVQGHSRDNGLHGLLQQAMLVLLILVREIRKDQAGLRDDAHAEVVRGHDVDDDADAVVGADGLARVRGDREGAEQGERAIGDERVVVVVADCVDEEGDYAREGGELGYGV